MVLFFVQVTWKEQEHPQPFRVKMCLFSFTVCFLGGEEMLRQCLTQVMEIHGCETKCNAAF